MVVVDGLSLCLMLGPVVLRDCDHFAAIIIVRMALLGHFDSLWLDSFWRLSRGHRAAGVLFTLSLDF